MDEKTGRGQIHRDSDDKGEHEPGSGELKHFPD